MIFFKHFPKFTKSYAILLLCQGMKNRHIQSWESGWDLYSPIFMLSTFTHHLLTTMSKMQLTTRRLHWHLDFCSTWTRHPAQQLHLPKIGMNNKYSCHQIDDWKLVYIFLFFSLLVFQVLNYNIWTIVAFFNKAKKLPQRKFNTKPNWGICQCTMLSIY